MFENDNGSAAKNQLPTVDEVELARNRDAFMKKMTIKTKDKVKPKYLYFRVVQINNCIISRSPQAEKPIKKGKQNRQWDNSGTSADAAVLDYSSPTNVNGQDEHIDQKFVDEHVCLTFLTILIELISICSANTLELAKVNYRDLMRIII